MAAWLPLIIQAAAILLPIIAPPLMSGLETVMGKIGASLPAGAKPALNAAIGAGLASLAGSDPSTGAIIAHVMRSGLVHEPAAPAPVVGSQLPQPQKAP